jgi:signal transduction histidine kinase
MTDAEVVATGIALPFSNWRANLGNYLQLVATNAIEVLHAAPSNPLSAQPPGREPTSHRVRISGRVLAAVKDTLFLRTSQRELVRVRPSEGTPMPSSGSTVEVSGFAHRAAGGHIVFDAAVRIVAAEHVAPTQPEETDPEALFTDANGIRKIGANHNGQTVRLKGIVRPRPEAFDKSEAFLLECGTHTFTVDTSGLPHAQAVNPKPGSTVMVAGLCIADFREDAIRMGFPHFMGYSLIPRAPSDIRILAQPPWWTMARLFAVVCILLVAIIAFAIWNRLLHMYSEKRGKELYRERIAHTRAQLKVEERTRLAVELHDSISQSLAGVAMHIDSASRANAAGGNASAFLNTARQILASCRRELQSCLWDLRSRTFEERDMNEAIERAVAPHAGDAKIKVRFSLPRAKLLETTTHTILYIIRELVVNAVRHGHATSIHIAGAHENDVLMFSVADNGCGFVPKNAPGPLQGHFGLQGVRERIKPFRGKIEIESDASKGTQVRIQMSIPEMKYEGEREN